ncbi:ATP synthase I [Rhodanobacter sp. OR87]|uniref:ATP synthase I n=1 Tax=Rhodanobacter sp. OR87 TaxID=1076523 RepID=UPI0009E0217B|nr:ATP synthase I [Rhodanobacter sp. OR87]
MPQAAWLVAAIAALIYFYGLDRGPQLYRCRLVQAARRRYVLNSLASGRRLALRIILLQLAVALLAGLVFLALGHREAVAAAAGATTVALGTALMSVRFFGDVGGAGQALGRLLTGMLLKWSVIVGGLVVILFQFKLPPPAAITGLAAAYAVYLVAFRFKG